MTTEVSSSDVLRAQMAGLVLSRSDMAYEDARRVHNGLIDRRPALVARCHGTADAQAAVRFGRERGLEIAVRGGGHNVAGNAVCDGGLMIDLSLMRGVHVAPGARRARAQHAPDGSGTKLAAIIVCHVGSPEAGAAAVAPVKRFGSPVMDVIGPMPYTAMNMLFDAGFPRGALNADEVGEDSAVSAAFGPNGKRLREVKRRYDPDNVFHLNQNIKP
jgi:hypothetical protein